MKGKIFLSLFTAFLFGLIGYFVLLLFNVDAPLRLAVLSGLLFALLLFPYLVVYGNIMDKRYAKFEKEMPSPVIYKTNGNLRIDNGKVKNGNIYFCESGIICACLEEKPYTSDQILWQDIARCQFDSIHLTIFVKDGRVLALTTPDAEKIATRLHHEEWIEKQAAVLQDRPQDSETPLH